MGQHGSTVVVILECGLDANGRPYADVTGVFTGFKNESHALDWINLIQAEWKCNPRCRWVISTAEQYQSMV